VETRNSSPGLRMAVYLKSKAVGAGLAYGL